MYALKSETTSRFIRKGRRHFNCRSQTVRGLMCTARLATVGYLARACHHADPVWVSSQIIMASHASQWTYAANNVAVSPIPALRLRQEQLDSLRACARGISLRFEKLEIVNALLLAGLVEKNIVGVIRITREGQEYLSTLSDVPL